MFKLLLLLPMALLAEGQLRLPNRPRPQPRPAAVQPLGTTTAALTPASPTDFTPSSQPTESSLPTTAAGRPRRPLLRPRPALPSSVLPASTPAPTPTYFLTEAQTQSTIYPSTFESSATSSPSYVPSVTPIITTPEVLLPQKDEEEPTSIPAVTAPPILIYPSNGAPGFEQPSPSPNLASPAPTTAHEISAINMAPESPAPTEPPPSNYSPMLPAYSSPLPDPPKTTLTEPTTPPSAMPAYITTDKLYTSPPRYPSNKPLPIQPPLSETSKPLAPSSDPDEDEVYPGASDDDVYEAMQPNAYPRPPQPSWSFQPAQPPKPLSTLSPSRQPQTVLPPQIRPAQTPPPKPYQPAPVRPSTTATPIIKYDNCRPGVNSFFPVPEDCSSYIECRRGLATQHSCPDGLYHNLNISWPEYPCSFPSQMSCQGRPIRQPAQPTFECPRQYGYFPRGDGTCDTYILCQEGKAQIMNCPVGLAYNPEKSSCDWPANVPSCNLNVFKGFKCPSAPTDEFGNPSELIYKYKYGSSCKEYVACHRESPRLLSCDPGLAFDESLSACVDADTVERCLGQEY